MYIIDSVWTSKPIKWIHVTRYVFGTACFFTVVGDGTQNMM